MVIVRLIGGLGNQLFQYAAGRALSHRHGVSLKLDASAFEQYPLRRYSLAPFNIAADFATPEEVAHLTGAGRTGFRKRVSQLVYPRLLPRFRTVYKERHFHYDSGFEAVGKRVYLIGFWQSERYFIEVADLLRKELTFQHPPDPPNRLLCEQIDAVDAISVHVRRGDYVSNPSTSAFHGSCSPAYYRAAVRHLAQGLSTPHVFAFSDDLAWVRANLSLDLPVTYVMHNGEAKDYEDLRLMGRCKHHVIANSTFSWWGAWLSDAPGKVVVAPRQWFNDPAIETRDVIPDTWLTL